MSDQLFGGSYGAPGIRATKETQENTFYFGRWEDQRKFTGLIDGAARDTGNAGDTSVLRAGLIMGRVTSSNKLKQWDPTATDGTEEPLGLLGLSVNTQTDGSKQHR